MANAVAPLARINRARRLSVLAGLLILCLAAALQFRFSSPSELYRASVNGGLIGFAGWLICITGLTDRVVLAGAGFLFAASLQAAWIWLIAGFIPSRWSPHGDEVISLAIAALGFSTLIALIFQSWRPFLIICTPIAIALALSPARSISRHQLFIISPTTAATLDLTLAAAFLIEVTRHYKNAPTRGLCHNCRYDLQGVEADRCPECGEPKGEPTHH